MIYTSKSRRQFLIGAGGAFLAIPFLPSLLPRAYAQGAVAKRFICLAQDNGRYAPDWYPASSVEALLRPVTGVPYMREMLMRDIPGNISQIFGASFNGPIRDKLMLIRGLDGLWRNTRGHQMSSILAGNLISSGAISTGEKKGPSVDFIIAKNAKSNPRAADSKSYLNLRLHPGWDMSFRYNAATDSMTPADRYASPLAAFNAIFGSSTSAPVPSDRKQKVVDQVFQSYKSVINSPRLAKAEKETLQEHIDTLNELQASIMADAPAMSCVGPSGMEGPLAYNDFNAVNIDRVLKQQMDLMIAAVKCGIVNVGTIMTSDASDDTLFSNLTLNGSPLTGTWHNKYAHSGMQLPEIRVITQRFAGHFAYVINALNVPEPGTNGTYLDNSLVYYANGMGDGYGHDYKDMAVMLAGGLAGRIRTGRYIDYTNHTNTQRPGRNYCSFLVALLQAFGLSPADYQQPNVSEGFGDDSLWGYGETRGVYEPWRAERKTPTPGILV